MRSGYVLPKPALADELDGHLGHAELGGQVSSALTGGGSLSDSTDLLFRELAGGRVFTVARRASLFTSHVSHVGSMRPKAQVGRIAARWVVAGVQHVKAFWNRSVGVRVGEPVRVDLVTVTALAESAVSAVVPRTGPQPAGVRPARLVHTFPEAQWRARPFRENGFHVRSLPCQ